MNSFLAFDLGASSGRAILGILDVGKISLKEIHRFENRMVQIHEHHYWNIYGLYQEMLTGMQKAGEAEIVPESIGIDTWGVDFALFDRNGILLSTPYAYRDKRNVTAMEDVIKAVPREKISELTGIAFWPFNSLYQLYAWKRDQPEVLAAADFLLFMPDIFNYFLTGIRHCDYTFASTSQLLNPFTRRWEYKLCDMLELPGNILPEISDPGKIIGKLSNEVVNITKLSDMSVTAAGSHDTAAAVVSVPAEGDEFAYISSGTWSLMGIESDRPVISEKTLAYNLTNEGGVGQKIRLLKNIMGLWLLQECKRIWAAAGNDYSYPELVRMAKSAQPFRSILEPDYMEFYNPPDMTQAITDFCKLTHQPAPENTGQFVRAILEGLAFKYRMVLDQLREVSGKRLEKLHIIGGGANNELLSQFSANATGIPVITGPTEATAVGNLMVQAMAMGHVKDLQEIRAVIRNSFDLKTFMPEEQSAWEEAYRKYLGIVDQVS
jgi:rhamnulokinase